MPNSVIGFENPAPRTGGRGRAVWPYGLFVLQDWHEGGMYTFWVGPYLLFEQTWGRAVRASHNSREFGALLICGRFFAAPGQALLSRSRCQPSSFILVKQILVNHPFVGLRIARFGSPPRPCRSPNERGARAYICTKACTLHRGRLGYDVRPRDSLNRKLEHGRETGRRRWMRVRTRGNSSAASTYPSSGLPGRQMRLRRSSCDVFPFVCDLGSA
jgi:hypothetical protein